MQLVDRALDFNQLLDEVCAPHPHPCNIWSHRWTPSWKMPRTLLDTSPVSASQLEVSPRSLNTTFWDAASALSWKTHCSASVALFFPSGAGMCGIKMGESAAEAQEGVRLKRFKERGEEEEEEMHLGVTARFVHEPPVSSSTFCICCFNYFYASTIQTQEAFFHVELNENIPLGCEKFHVSAMHPAWQDTPFVS